MVLLQMKVNLVKMDYKGVFEWTFSHL